MERLNTVWDDYNLYEARTGDTFDDIARQAYGDEYYAELLISVNPEYSAVLSFDGGEVITIPIINIAASAIMPPWR